MTSETRQWPWWQQWSRLLTWHVVVATPAVLVVALAGILPWRALDPAVALAGVVTTVLGLPWSVLLPVDFVDLGAADRVWDDVWWQLPALVNVVVHWTALVLVRSRDRRPRTAGGAPPAGATTAPSASDPGAVGGAADARAAGLVVLFGTCAALGACIWGAWLGWDTAYYTTPDLPHLQGPYTPAQVMACAATVGLAVAALSRLRHPAVVAGGVTAGCWTVWTAQAAAGPNSGPLWAVGSVLLLVGAAAGTSVAALTGYLLRPWHRRVGSGTPPSVLDGPARAVGVSGPAAQPAQWWRTGLALVGVAEGLLLVAAVVRVGLPLTSTYLAPLRLLLEGVAVAAAALGVVLVVKAVRLRRAAAQPLAPLLPRLSAAAVLLALVVVGHVLPAGDGFDGQVGVMAGPDGTPVAVLGLCRGSVDEVVVEDLDSEVAARARDRYETSYAARLEHPDRVRGVVQVDLARPEPPWGGSALGAAARGEVELNISATGRQSLLNDTCSTRAEVAALAPGMVTYSVWEKPFGGWAGNEQVALSDFAAVSCSGRGRYP